MPITEEDVAKMAELAKLELTRLEMESFAEQLGSIISYIDKLNELETADAAPMSHCVPAAGDFDYALREDAVRPGLGQQLATENAPGAEAGFFKVPKVIGG